MKHVQWEHLSMWNSPWWAQLSLNLVGCIPRLAFGRTSQGCNSNGNQIRDTWVEWNEFCQGSPSTQHLGTFRGKIGKALQLVWLLIHGQSLILYKPWLVFVHYVLCMTISETAVVRLSADLRDDGSIKDGFHKTTRNVNVGASGTIRHSNSSTGSHTPSLLPMVTKTVVSKALESRSMYDNLNCESALRAQSSQRPPGISLMYGLSLILAARWGESRLVSYFRFLVTQERRITQSSSSSAV